MANTLSLIHLVAIDTRFWAGRATSLYCHARQLPLWLRPHATALALEVHANIQSLRAPGPICPVPPSLCSWVITVAVLFVVAPALAMAAVRLFLICYALRLTPYRAIGSGVALVFGAVVGFALVSAWRWV